MYYAVQSIHFNDRAPSLFWLSKSTAITTEYNFTHTPYPRYIHERSFHLIHKKSSIPGTLPVYGGFLF